MNQYHQALYLLGYTKSTIEWLARTAMQSQVSESDELINLLVDFEEYFNRQIQKIVID